jgi:hypothetical protein
MVSSLGNQTLPEEIIEDIKSSLERKTLLQDAPAPQEPQKGRRHLFLRKAASYAAMILLALILAVVVYQILGPTEVSNAPHIAHLQPKQEIKIQPGNENEQINESTREQTTVASDTTSRQPDFLKTFDVKIELVTDQPDLVTSVIGNCAEHFSLDYIGPQNSISKTASLSLGRNELEFLFSQIDSVLSDKSQFRAELNYNKENIIVENLKFNRFAEFFNSETSEKTFASIRQAETISRLDNTQLARDIESETGAGINLSRIPKPVLTSDIETLPEKEPVTSPEKFFLTIKVKNLN